MPIISIPALSAALRQARHASERTEEAILRGLLGLGEDLPRPNAAVRLDGEHVDVRSGLRLPVGFQIFRRYNGREHRARVHDGGWLLETDRTLHPTLNKLNRAVDGRFANAWKAWMFVGSDGAAYPVGQLRPPSRIFRRRRVISAH